MAVSPPETTKPALGGFCRCFELVGRGYLKQVGIYLFFLINTLLVNLLGIPGGTLRGLDSDGRSLLSSTSSRASRLKLHANGRDGFRRMDRTC